MALDLSNLTQYVDLISGYLTRKIILEGEVSNFDEMEIAEDAAWAIPGVAEVKNELVVD